MLRSYIVPHGVRDCFGICVLLPVLMVASGCAGIRGVPLLQSDLLDIAATDTRKGDVTVKFMGVSTLLFSDGQTNLLIDGFFTRPLARKAIFDRPVEPDVEKIKQSLKRFHINQLDAVLVSHSHYDHAMDSGVVAGLTQARVLGSKSTRNIVIGSNVLLNNSQRVRTADICVVSPDAGYRFGDFMVTFVESKHADLSLLSKLSRRERTGTTVDSVLTPPAKISDYGEGITYSIHLEHPQGNALVHPSANYRENSIDKLRADVVFLGVSTPLVTDRNAISRYWHEVVEKSWATKIYPIHWDSPSGPLSDTMRTTPLLFDDIDTTFRTLIALTREHGGTMELLPLGEPVSIFRNLPSWTNAPDARARKSKVSRSHIQQKVKPMHTGQSTQMVVCQDLMAER